MINSSCSGYIFEFSYWRNVGLFIFRHFHFHSICIFERFFVWCGVWNWYGYHALLTENICFDFDIWDKWLSLGLSSSVNGIWWFLIDELITSVCQTSVCSFFSIPKVCFHVKAKSILPKLMWNFRLYFWLYF